MEKTMRRRGLLSILLVLTLLLAPLSALRVRADQGVTATASANGSGDWKGSDQAPEYETFCKEAE